MYAVVLAIHNILRWVVLVLAVLAVVNAYWGWFGRREWTERGRKLGSFLTIGIDIQILSGLLLYIFLSDITKAALRDFSAAMGVADARFFAVEHVVYMLLAVVFAHLGSALPRRVDQDFAKFRRAALWFTLALLLILLGMPWGRPLIPGLG